MSTFDRTHPYLATINERFLLTKQGSTKETYHISLDLKNSGITFKVGDSIGVFAQNDPVLVNHLIEAMQAKGTELIEDPRSKELMTLREFLSKKANLSRLNSSFLKLLYSHEKFQKKKNQLDHLFREENRTLLKEYLATHDPLDILREYRETCVPLQELCCQFGPLLPRFYSVASSQRVHPHEVHLTVALFTYTHLEEKRFGVASHFLCRLAEKGKTPIPIYVQPAHSFSLPDDPNIPLIMIGPGTGVAPFRGFLQERISSTTKGKNWLFFGERNREFDFFYEDFWQSLVSNRFLRMDVAFSRDQQEKIYVQHRMLENAKDLWEWLQEGAHIYVCGDAQRMAKDVESTLHQIACQQGNLSQEESKQFFKNMRSQKKYLLDVY
jgi:sulfite reductase (NADPH) flavoprotein alpha-component